jgi:hypothetical protein
MSMQQDFANRATQEGAEVKGGRTEQFKNDLVYPVQIESIVYKLSTYGQHQAEVTLSKVMDDDSTKKAGKLWLDLPVFSDDEIAEKDQETLNKAKKARANTFAQLLAVAIPTAFGFGVGSAKQRSQAVQGAAEALIEDGQLEFTPARGFYVKATNKKNEKYSYNNFYQEPPIGKV